MNFRQQATAALLGIVGVFIPALAINTMTLGINSVVVFAGVLFAALTGYLFCSWTNRQIDEHDDDAPGEPPTDDTAASADVSTCGTCGFPSDALHSGWHAMNCAGAGSNANFEEGWQQP